MKIKKEVYESILKSIPEPPPEKGGILGQQNGVITVFYCDDNSSSEFIDRYVPDTLKLNKVISEWQKNDIYFCGIYHSHYEGDTSLSGGDIEYIKVILDSLVGVVEELYFPLVFANEGYMNSFKAYLKNGKVVIKFEEIHFY